MAEGAMATPHDKSVANEQRLHGELGKNKT